METGLLTFSMGEEVARPIAPRIHRQLTDAEETFLGGAAAQEGAML